LNLNTARVGPRAFCAIFGAENEYRNTPSHAPCFDIDAALLGGSERARWFDPASGNFKLISESPLPNRGLAHFTTPGRNAAGATDWVLVLEVVSGHAADSAAH
jgi:hypothetical protein